MNNFRFALPQLSKNAGFIAVAVFTFALNAGAPKLLDAPTPASTNSFAGTKAGDQKTVAGVQLCWCPPGKFLMGSPASEPERRPGEDQIEVTLTKGFWMGKYEVTQGQWKRVMGK